MNAWDEMSKTYPRYGEASMMSDVAKVLKFCETKGVDFNGSILDIGAGTGIIDLEIALKNSVSITALDTSAKMLEILERDAQNLGVKDKISTVVSSWEDYELKDKFNISIASMSPAINSLQTAQKFIHSTKNLGLHIGWGAYKNCEFLDALMPKPNPNIKGCIKTLQMREILSQNGIKFESELFDTSWEDIMDEKTAFGYARSMLLRCELEVDEAHIKSVIAKFRQDDGVHILTKAQKGIILFCVK